VHDDTVDDSNAKSAGADEQREEAGRSFGAFLDASLAVIAAVPPLVWLGGAAVTLVFTFPVDMPSEGGLVGAALGNRPVVWILRLTAVGVSLLVLAAGFFALRSIAAYIETGQWVTTAGPGGLSVGDADKLEVLRTENQDLKNDVARLEDRLKNSDGVAQFLYQQLKDARDELDAARGHSRPPDDAEEDSGDNAPNAT
jgi:hypothetical protein